MKPSACSLHCPAREDPPSCRSVAKAGPREPGAERVAGRSGFSLIEVVIATGILGVSLAVLLTAASTCLKILSYTTRYQEAQRVRSQAEAEYPLIVSNDLDELNVPETRYDNDIVFSRTVDEDDEDEDDLYVVTTRVTWTERGVEQADEVVQYVYFEDEDDE